MKQKLFLLLITVFFVSGCYPIVERYNPPPVGMKKIYIKEPEVYKRKFSLAGWTTLDPDKVNKEKLGELINENSQDPDVKEAIEGAKVFKESLEKKLREKGFVIENSKCDDCIIIKSYISIMPPAVRGFWSRVEYFRGEVVVFAKVEYRDLEIARILQGGQYCDKEALWPRTLKETLLLISERIAPKIEEILNK